MSHNVYNNLQNIAERAFCKESHRDGNPVASIASYYDGSLYSAMDFLILVISARGNKSLMDITDPEYTRKAIEALDILKDYQLFISKIEENLLFEAEKKLEQL